jgi:hypothetical protein
MFSIFDDNINKNFDIKQEVKQEKNIFKYESKIGKNKRLFAEI